VERGAWKKAAGYATQFLKRRLALFSVPEDSLLVRIKGNDPGICHQLLAVLVAYNVVKSGINRA
jgi:hypothetical protein